MVRACFFFSGLFVGSRPRQGFYSWQVNEAEVLGMDFLKEAESKAQEDMGSGVGGVKRTNDIERKQESNKSTCGLDVWS